MIKLMTSTVAFKPWYGPNARRLLTYPYDRQDALVPSTRGDFPGAIGRPSLLNSARALRSCRSQRVIAAQRVQFCDDVADGDATNQHDPGLQPLNPYEPSYSATSSKPVAIATPNAMCLPMRAHSQGSVFIRRSRLFRGDVSDEPVEEQQQQARSLGLVGPSASDRAGDPLPVVCSAFMFPATPRAAGGGYDGDGYNGGDAPGCPWPGDNGYLARSPSTQPSPLRCSFKIPGPSAPQLQLQLRSDCRGIQPSGCSGDDCYNGSREYGATEAWMPKPRSPFGTPRRGPRMSSSVTAAATATAATVQRADDIRMVAVPGERRSRALPISSPTACGVHEPLGVSDSSDSARSSSTGLDVSADALDTPRGSNLTCEGGVPYFGGRTGTSSIKAAMPPAVGVLSLPVPSAASSGGSGSVSMSKLLTPATHGSCKSAELGRRRSEHGSMRRGRRQQERRRMPCWTDADEKDKDGSEVSEVSDNASSEADSDLDEIVPAISHSMSITAGQCLQTSAAGIDARSPRAPRPPAGAAPGDARNQMQPADAFAPMSATATPSSSSGTQQCKPWPGSKSARQLLFYSLQDFDFPPQPPQPQPPQPQPQPPQLQPPSRTLRRASTVREVAASAPEGAATPRPSTGRPMAEGTFPAPRELGSGSGSGAAIGVAASPANSVGGSSGSGTPRTSFEAAAESMAARRAALKGWSSRGLLSTGGSRRRSLAQPGGSEYQAPAAIDAEAAAMMAAAALPPPSPTAARVLKPASVLAGGSGSGSFGFPVRERRQLVPWNSCKEESGSSEGGDEDFGGREGARSRAAKSGGGPQLGNGGGTAAAAALERPKPPRRLPNLFNLASPPPSPCQEKGATFRAKSSSLLKVL